MTSTRTRNFIAYIPEHSR